MNHSQSMLGLLETPLVLASASPRRRHLLESQGLTFETRIPEVDESQIQGPNPVMSALDRAVAKAKACAKPEGDALVVAADTVVVSRNRELGKPSNEMEAYGMLEELSRSTHTVITGVCVLDESTGKWVCDSASTEVTFDDLTQEDLESLVQSGEARDKAGAYGIQGLAAWRIREIRGDYYNVVGLPLFLLGGLVRQLTSVEANS